MEEVLLRLHHIGDQIFHEIDPQSLTKCRSVAKTWKSFIDLGKVHPSIYQIIQEYIDIDRKDLMRNIRKINKCSNVYGEHAPLRSHEDASRSCLDVRRCTSQTNKLLFLNLKFCNYLKLKVKDFTF